MPGLLDDDGVLTSTIIPRGSAAIKFGVRPAAPTEGRQRLVYVIVNEHYDNERKKRPSHVMVNEHYAHTQSPALPGSLVVLLHCACAFVRTHAYMSASASMPQVPPPSSFASKSAGLQTQRKRNGHRLRSLWPMVLRWHRWCSRFLLSYEVFI